MIQQTGFYSELSLNISLFLSSSLVKQDIETKLLADFECHNGLSLYQQIIKVSMPQQLYILLDVS